MVDVEPDHLALRVEVDVETVGNLPAFRPRLGVKLDVEAVDFGVVVQLHDGSSNNRRGTIITDFAGGGRRCGTKTCPGDQAERM
jgi:hypothetical protein